MSKQDDAAIGFVSVAGELAEVEGLGPLTRELRRIEAVNQAFYDAYRDRDIDAMSRLWLRSPHVRCVHPSGELAVGWPEVRESWVEQFASLEQAGFHLEDVHVEVAGRIAWVNLLAYTTLHTDEGDIINASAIATNLFELSEGEWKVTLHHSSSFLEDELDDEEDDDLIDVDPDRPGGSGIGSPN